MGTCGGKSTGEIFFSGGEGGGMNNFSTTGETLIPPVDKTLPIMVSQ